jgi:hypothetical protein
MCIIAQYVNDYVHCRNGQPPKSKPALRAFAAAVILRDNLLGIDTAVAAAACTGASLPAVRAAVEILQTGDPHLARDVLRGFEPLLQTAAEIRNRVQLIETFKSASVEDRIAFAQTVGVEMLFNDVVAPALETMPAGTKANGAAVYSS